MDAANKLNPPELARAKEDYSNLSASIGFRLAALYAG